MHAKATLKKLSRSLPNREREVLHRDLARVEESLGFIIPGIQRLITGIQQAIEIVAVNDYQSLEDSRLEGPSQE